MVGSANTAALKTQSASITIIIIPGNGNQPVSRWRNGVMKNTMDSHAHDAGLKNTFDRVFTSTFSGFLELSAAEPQPTLKIHEATRNTTKSSFWDLGFVRICVI